MPGTMCCATRQSNWIEPQTLSVDWDLKQRRLFCFGCGDTATRLAVRFITAGGRAAGTRRTAEGVAELQGLGIEGHRFDGAAALADTALDGVTDILCSIPPGEAGDDGVLRWHGDLMAALPTLRWVGLLSTTGVYGDVDGAWVDEDAPLSPMNARSERRVAQERRWLEWGESAGLPVQVFRLPGIYGPGRSPFDRLRSGKAQRIVKPGHVFNRIHVDDIGSALLLGMQRPEAGPVFNLADDEPVAAETVLAYAAELAGLPVPPAIPFEEAELSPMGRQFWAECKRIDTRRVREQLGFEPKYPSYREGLEAILTGETPPD